MIGPGRKRITVSVNESNYKYVKEALINVGKRQFAAFVDRCITIMAADLKSCKDVEEMKKEMEKFFTEDMETTLKRLKEPRE